VADQLTFYYRVYVHHYHHRRGTLRSRAMLAPQAPRMTMTAEELRRAARAMTAALLDKWESKHALDAAQHQGRREDVARARERFRAAAASCGDVDDFPALGAWVAVRSADIAAAEALLDAVVIPVIRERFRALRLRALRRATRRTASCAARGPHCCVLLRGRTRAIFSYRPSRWRPRQLPVSLRSRRMVER
jgi:hypothetical protein